MADTRIVDKGLAREFIMGGNAVFTLVSKKTGSRFTFRVRRSRKAADPLHHVEVLTGHSTYSYIGTLLPEQRFSRGRRSELPDFDGRVLAFGWFWKTLHEPRSERQLAIPEMVEMWHVGRCGRCARPLTDPESIQSGFGPECRAKTKKAA